MAIGDNQIRAWGKTGIIIVERNIEQIADVLRILCDRVEVDPELLREMGRLNRQEAELRWSWEVWKDAYSAFLKKGLNHA